MASQSLSVTLSRMASCHEWSAAALTHVTCAVHICDRSGPHVPIMSVFLSKAAALCKLKMCYGRAPSCFPSHTKVPQKPFGWRHNLSRVRARDLETIMANSQQTQMQAQKSGMTWGPPPLALITGEQKSLPQPAESVSQRATKWP